MNDLEKRAKEYATYVNPENGEKSLDWDLFNSLIKFTTKETELLSKHIVELQKTNGSLTDRVNGLEHELKAEQLTKAKELLRHWVNSYGYIDVALCKQTDQFISEVTK